MITATHLHALVIHFPIALLLAGFLSEVISLFSKRSFFREAALYLLILGALGAIVAFLSGSSAGEGIEEGPLKIPMELHEQAATITFWLTMATAVFRILIAYFKYNRSWTKWVGLVLFAMIAAGIARTGYLGGQLVYKHGAGVEMGLPDFNNTPAANSDSE